MPIRATAGLPTELVLWILSYGVHHFLVEHPATAVAIACVSHAIYDFVRPTLYRSFSSRLPQDSDEAIHVDAAILQKSNQALVKRLFVAPFSNKISGLDRLINLAELNAPWTGLLISDNTSWGKGIVCAAFRAPLGGLSSSLTNPALRTRSLSQTFPNLTHLTLLAASPRAGNMMGFSIEVILGSLNRLTHFGLDMGDDAYLLLGTGAKDNITNHGLEQDQYAIDAVIAMQAALKYGPDSNVVPQGLRAALGLGPKAIRKCLHRVALRVPAAYATLWEIHMLPRMTHFMKEAAGDNSPEVGDRLLVWCETSVCDSFAQKISTLRRDFLAGKDLWSEAVPFRELVTDYQKV